MELQQLAANSGDGFPKKNSGFFFEKYSLFLSFLKGIDIPQFKERGFQAKNLTKL
jgi:hypothetical protein